MTASAILPGATIGILGGGQLGRMTAMAARTLGYDVHALDPDPACSANAVVDRLVVAPFDDADAASELARYCDSGIEFTPLRDTPVGLALDAIAQRLLKNLDTVDGVSDAEANERRE